MSMRTTLVEAFLRELKRLSEKYDIYIKGDCNYCNNPYLIDEKEEYLADCLDWDKNENRYYVIHRMEED